MKAEVRPTKGTEVTSQQQILAEGLVARLRGVNIPARDDFFLRMMRKLSNQELYDSIIGAPYEIVTMVCRVWVVAHELDRLPSDVDLWPFIEVITPEDLRFEASRFWWWVHTAAAEMDREQGL